MRRLWCILLACVIPSCGGNSTGPEPTPQYLEPKPLPEPDPQIELSYENLAGWWRSEKLHSIIYGTQADSSIYRGKYFWRFDGKYFLNDPYIGARGESRSYYGMNRELRAIYTDIQFHIVTLTTIETGSLQTPYPSSLGRDTLRSPYPDWITIQLDTILTLKSIPASNYRALFGLSDTTRDISEQMISMSAAEFSALLDSLKSKNVAGQPQFLDQPGTVYRKFRISQ